MKYQDIKQGRFLERPNRFIAYVEVDGRKEVCHVKNTGRCREILIPGVVVFLQEFQNANRKTKYDLIAVEKETSSGKRLINIDSQAPNKVTKECLEAGWLLKDIQRIKPEYTFGASRLDFYLERKGKPSQEPLKTLIEVKGVTLEVDGVAMFPDAPTERGVKHIYELCEAIRHGYSCYILFLIQMSDVGYFTPNIKMHAAFGEALQYAAIQGVHILAQECQITPDSLVMGKAVEVKL